MRDAERRSEGALADAPLGAARLDVHDDVGVREPVAQGLLHPVCGRVPLAHGLRGRDADDDVRVVAAARLAHAEPPELDRRVELGDRLSGLAARHRATPGP